MVTYVLELSYGREPKAQNKAIPTYPREEEMKRAQRHKINIQNTFLLHQNQQTCSKYDMSTKTNKNKTNTCFHGWFLLRFRF